MANCNCIHVDNCGWNISVSGVNELIDILKVNLWLLKFKFVYIKIVSQRGRNMFGV